jgi:8-oxo-dGTP pyrophosphatase MutT (NUDIX family)
MDKSTHTLLETGSWGDDISWELYTTSILPPVELCSAVMAVAISNDKIVLTRSERGWGMLGGHIESGENFEDALRREALEEGGFIIDTYRLFAIRKIISRRPIPHQQEGRTYPHPISYLPYYWATTKYDLKPPTGEEIIESCSFNIQQIPSLSTRDQATIEAGWTAYNNQHHPNN